MANSDEFDDILGRFSREEYIRKLKNKYVRPSPSTFSSSPSTHPTIDSYPDPDYFSRPRNSNKYPKVPFVPEQMPFVPGDANSPPCYFLPVIYVPQNMMQPPPTPQYYYEPGKETSGLFGTFRSKSMVNLARSSLNDQYLSSSCDFSDKFDFSSTFDHKFEPYPPFFKTGYSDNRPTIYPRTFLDLNQKRTEDQYFCNQDFVSKSTLNPKDSKNSAKRLKISPEHSKTIPLARKARQSQLSWQNFTSAKDFCGMTDFQKTTVNSQTTEKTTDCKNVQTILRDVTKMLLLLPNESLSYAQQLRNLKDFLEDKPKAEVIKCKKNESTMNCRRSKSKSPSSSRSTTPDLPSNRRSNITPRSSFRNTKIFNFCSNKELYSKINKN